MMRNSVLSALALIYFILETIPAGIGSDKYLLLPKKHRFVCHLHKGDDQGCDSG